MKGKKMLFVKVSRCFIGLLVAALFVSCAPKGEIFTEKSITDKSLSRIYVYMVPRVGFADIKVKFNNSFFKLSDGAYKEFMVKPGDYKFTGIYSTPKVTFVTELKVLAGEDYYIEAEWDVESFHTVPGGIELPFLLVPDYKVSFEEKKRSHALPILQKCVSVKEAQVLKL